MLNILLMDSNFYQMSGLCILILNQLSVNRVNRVNEVCFLLSSQESNKDLANVIFHDDLVTINLFNKAFIRGNNGILQDGMSKITIHIPLFYKGKDLNDISLKIFKILEIACADYDALINKENTHWKLGFKKYVQLSDAENDVMMFIGLGYNSAEISMILNRSRKTIRTHYRNAFRKMGAENKAEFYRYASFIARCGRGERNTLCL